MVEVRPGQIVYSIAGRDKGKYYIVVKKLDKHFVLVANGSSRPLSKPKRKNLRHLQFHNKGSIKIEKKGLGELTDSNLVKALRNMVIKECGK